MSEKKEAALVLTGDEIVKALRCCATDSNSGGGCRNCPLDKRAGRLECSELICLMAADRIGELQEELRKLHDATEDICQRENAEMVRLAKECNAALERGLHGVSDAAFAKITEHQQVLSGLGEGHWMFLDMKSRAELLVSQQENGKLRATLEVPVITPLRRVVGI